MRNLLLSLLSTLFIVVLLEVGARISLGELFGPQFQTYLVYDNSRGWKLKPNFNGEIKSGAREFTFDVKVTAEGYRYDNGMQGFKEGSADIVLFGDSNAFGFGLKSNETFSSQLAATLEKQGKNIKVFNAGVPGYDILQPILLLKEMEIHEEMLLLFLVHPVNDLVNTANSIDYGAYKPYVYEENGSIKVEDPRRYFAHSPYEFSRDFSQLNQFFSFQKNNLSLLDQITNMSALVYVVRYWNSLIIYHSDNLPVEIMWDEISKQEFVNRRLNGIKENPKRFASRVWTEITERREDQKRLVHYVGELYTKALHYASTKGAKICVILAPEAYRVTPFFLEQTNLVQRLLPDLDFQWGATASALYTELRKRRIPVIVPELLELETGDETFIFLDDHKSAAAYKYLSQEVSEYYLSQIRQKEIP